MALSSVKVIAVIVNYNLPDETLECVQSLLDSIEPQPQIIIVDNASADDSISKISQAFPFVELIRLDENLGFVGGYNRGIEAALSRDASHILILNNDTIIEKTALQRLFEADFDIGVPKILFYYDRGIIQSSGARWRSFPPMVVLRGYLQKDTPVKDRPIQLDYASACALLIKRRVFEKIGGFDIDYENYVEDYDFCYRAKTGGFNIGLIPDARIYHKGSLTGGKFPKRRRWFIGRNSVLFYRKNNRFPVVYLWTYLAWLFIREVIKGNIIHLPDYWAGVQAGFKLLVEKKMPGKGSLPEDSSSEMIR